MKKISICIPTYNRVELLFDSFKDIIAMPEIGEIVIVDDCSSLDLYDEIVCVIKEDPGFYQKIKLFRNQSNLDCYKNKREAVSKAANQYVILLDSDNKIDKRYIETIYNQHWSPERIIQPSFAMPHFDFREFNGLLVHKTNVSRYMHNGKFTTMLNAMNFFVNADRYLETFDDSVDPVTSDSIYFNYLWLASGNSIYVSPNLQYEHRVDSHGSEEGSHYVKNNKRTPHRFHEMIINKLSDLR